MDLEKQQEYDELPYFGEANQASSAANRKIAEKMSTLLIVYGKEGMEWSISPAGQRLVRREFPRRSWFHKHEYVEILYVIEGSFTQILLGEEIRFEQGEFVITDQNCEHADYIEAKDAAVLFLQIRVMMGQMRCRDFCFMRYGDKKENRVFYNFKDPKNIPARR